MEKVLGERERERRRGEKWEKSMKRMRKKGERKIRIKNGKQISEKHTYRIGKAARTENDGRRMRKKKSETQQLPLSGRKILCFVRTGS